MGVDLIPRNPGGGGLYYSWEGWRWVREFANANGISPSEFAESNDGHELSSATCRALAIAIENHQREYNEVFAGTCYGLAPARKHARVWRQSDGFEQW